VEGISDTGQQVESHIESAEKLPQILKVILVNFKLEWNEIDCTGYDSMSTRHQIESPTNGNFPSQFPRAAKFSIQQVAVNPLCSLKSYAFKVRVRGLLP